MVIFIFVTRHLMCRVTVASHPALEHLNTVDNEKCKYAMHIVVCYTAVFSVVTQRSSPLTSGEERCVTTLKTAV